MIPKPPESPKVEKEILSKLDEVNSQVTSWLKQLETKKGAEPKTGPKDLGKIKLNSKKEENEEKDLLTSQDTIKLDKEDEEWFKQLEI